MRSSLEHIPEATVVAVDHHFDLSEYSPERLRPAPQIVIEPERRDSPRRIALGRVGIYMAVGQADEMVRHFDYGPTLQVIEHTAPTNQEDADG